MREDCVIVMAKRPDPGAAKTRLAAGLGAERAEALAGAFLRDTADLVLGLPGITPLFSYTPPAARSEFQCLLGDAAILHEQPDGDLGVRLDAAFREAFRRGARRVAVIATDSPSLPPAFIEAAFTALHMRSLAIGPAVDGGYYLFGMTAHHPELFERIDWSTERVFKQTLDRAAALELSPVVLPEWYDVDDTQGLARLCGDLGTCTGRLRHTRAVLAGRSVPELNHNLAHLTLQAAGAVDGR